MIWYVEEQPFSVGGGGPYRKTARKPVPLYIIQYSLVAGYP
jgi:hypothetical protein